MPRHYHKSKRYYYNDGNDYLPNTGSRKANIEADLIGIAVLGAFELGKAVVKACNEEPKRRPQPQRRPVQQSSIPFDLPKPKPSYDPFDPFQNKVKRQANAATSLSARPIPGELVHVKYTVMPLAKIVTSGFLEKQGVINSSYKKRFFVLTNRQILYYYSIQNEKDIPKIIHKNWLAKGAPSYQKGSITLNKFKKLTFNAKTNQFRLTSYSDSGRDYLLKAQSGAELNTWIQLIRNVCAAKKDPWVGLVKPGAKSEKVSEPGSFTPGNALNKPAEPNAPRRPSSDELLDDIAPMSYIDSYKGPGFTDCAPSAPDFYATEGFAAPAHLAAGNEVHASAPLQPSETEVAGEPDYLEGEGQVTGEASHI